MIFLGISLIISAAIIAATAIFLFNKNIKMYKETYSSLFKDDPVEMPDSSNNTAKDKIVDIDFGGF